MQLFVYACVFRSQNAKSKSFIAFAWEGVKYGNNAHFIDMKNIYNVVDDEKVHEPGLI